MTIPIKEQQRKTSNYKGGWLMRTGLLSGSWKRAKREDEGVEGKWMELS